MRRLPVRHNAAGPSMPRSGCLHKVWEILTGADALGHVTPVNGSDEHPYLAAFRGRFTSLLRWPDLDAFWSVIKDNADHGWYVYEVGEAPPSTTVSADQLRHFIDRLDADLRIRHDEKFCGIVYTDSRTDPAFVKIYHPDKLGSVCGFSEVPALPGWTLSRLPPVALDAEPPSITGLRGWWRSLTRS